MVSRENLEVGRTQQKLRTRNALLDAATRLVARGERPKLALVAKEAMVSRATAYRYFPSEEALFVEVTLTREFLSAEEVLPDDATIDPAERAVHVQRYLIDHAAKHEAEFRMFLRVTFDQWLAADGQPEEPLRMGRRLEMFERALEPLGATVDAETLEKLKTVLAVMSGIEAVVAVRDVCELPLEEGKEAVAWAAATLVRAALEGARSS